ncbi:hypothetical protein O6H91_08G058100 [Diphasiastrum complanatum]|uniref:Uncharacterized protein n=1 Tax=Diphasiastrum complanatum TaxID=34168 RepID=A0ACC2CXX4_DIPCM|nr:hypothetical protein O6H91_08G058100 [Diphasiastrum complanatum]
MALLAACAGDTIKLFDVLLVNGDPCVLQYAPSPGFQVNSARWNHTNLVLATAGDDRKISLWMQNGRSLGTVPAGSEVEDIGNESILVINFSHKSSRYLCSGGTGKLVRVWDMQRRRCIKWLKGHVATVTGVTYNCRDEHLASISLRGDLILHSLASGSRVTELKDPHDQVLRVLESSPNSRHLLVTAGDDGSIHLWDTTARIPKVSWVRRHLAPISGTCFSSSNEKVLVSVGLDKKMYILDSGMKKPVHCIPGEAPFSSLALKDDGCTLAAGTTSGRVMFYDIRAKPQPTTVLHAYSSSDPIINLSWQRSSPILVDKENCSEQVALLGGIGEDLVLMPDPIPSALLSTKGRIPSSARLGRRFGRSLSSCSERQLAGVGLGTGVSTSTASLHALAGEEASSKKLSWKNRAALQIHRNPSTTKDDMEIFSPLVDVQPITPSFSNLSNNDELKKTLIVQESLPGSSVRAKLVGFKTPFPGEKMKSERVKQLSRGASYENDISRSLPTSPATSGRTMLTKDDRSPSTTPPEDWGGDGVVGKSSSFISQALYSALSISPSNGSKPYGPETAEVFSRTDISAEVANTKPVFRRDSKPAALSSDALFRGRSEIDKSFPPSNKQSSFQVMSNMRHEFLAGPDSPAQQNIGINSSQDYVGISKIAMQDGVKAIDSSTSSRLDPSISTEENSSSFPQGPPSFALQLVQRALEESLGTLQSAIHEDVRNLHLDLLRQSHIQQLQISSLVERLMQNQADLLEEVQALRRENEELRRFN